MSMFSLIEIAEAAGYIFDVPVADGQITGINIILLGIIAITVAAVAGVFVYGVYSVLPMGRTVATIFVLGGAAGLSLAGTTLGIELFELAFAERVRVLQAAAVGVTAGSGYTAVRYRPKKLREIDGDEDEKQDTDGENESMTDRKPRATKAVPEVTDHE